MLLACLYGLWLMPVIPVNAHGAGQGAGTGEQGTLTGNSHEFVAAIDRRRGSTELRGNGASQTIQTTLSDQPQRWAPRRLRTLKRLVRHFDFEEAEQVPVTMPHHFYRYGADGEGAAHGFPPFGRMRLTNDVAYSGNWSFEFELDGGSMAARVPTAVIPIMPLADYLVTTRVRTKGLKHARARLVAWLHDQEGNEIQDSRVASKPVATDGEWDVLDVRVSGAWPDAADLVLELQLVQPRQYREDAAESDDPMPQDVTGRAWFDDVSIWHLPRIDLKVSGRKPPEQRESNAGDRDVRPMTSVVVAPEQPMLTAIVRDYTLDTLNARIRVFDYEGRTVFDAHFPDRVLQRELRLDLPLDTYGWYRAVLDIENGDHVTARQWIDLAYVPPAHRAHARWQNPLAFSLPESWMDEAEHLPELLQRSGINTLIMPVWTRDARIGDAGERQQIIGRTIETLRGRPTELIFSFESVPTQLAQRIDTGEDDVLFAMDRLDGQWQDAINELLVNFGVEVSHWQLGGTGSKSMLWRSNAEQLVERARNAIAEFAPKPNVLVAMTAEQATEKMRLPGRNIWVPYHMQPETIGDAVAEWSQDGQPLFVTLERPPETLYAESHHALDLTLRVLHTWRGAAPAIALQPTWHAPTDMREPYMPAVTLPVVRHLAEQLGGRRFVKELSLGRGVHCWVLAGSGPDDGAMIVWRDSERAPRTDQISLLLAEGPVTVRDVFGNARRVERVSDQHTIELTEMPQFIEGVHLELVLFRGGFALDPSFIRAERRMHGHELVLHNPWNMPIEGTIRLQESEDWRISPRVHRFSIRPGGEVRLPVEIVLERGMVAGLRPLHAEVDVSAETQYRFELETPVEIGLDHLDLHATWRVAHNSQSDEHDLIITQYITNTGDRPVSLDAYVLGAGVRQQRRVIGGLQPDEMAIRNFRIPNGASLLAGRHVRIGISERDGVARLNKQMEISELAAFQATAPIESPER